ncbi:MAG: hypothetical protein ACYC8T_39285 [Myxococcaceae bacterium]
MGRGALLGLGAGLLGGAILLLVNAIRGYSLDCTGLPSDECFLQQSAAAEMGRLQTLVAVAMAIASAAVFLLLRSYNRAKPSAPP